MSLYMYTTSTFHCHLCFCFHFYYPGAAGARELAHRAPGAIILGGGCEFVLAFFKPCFRQSGGLTSFTCSRLAKNLFIDVQGIVEIGRLLPFLRQSPGVEHDGSDLTVCERSYGLFNRPSMLPLRQPSPISRQSIFSNYRLSFVIFSAI